MEGKSVSLLLSTTVVLANQFYFYKYTAYVARGCSFFVVWVVGRQRGFSFFFAL